MTRLILALLLLTACASKPNPPLLIVIDRGISIPPNANHVRVENGVVILEISP